ncbi:MAG: AI-2E family transporter [Akkermansiaceae bacterium]|jgi:predicted PurR-regulated permease PerM|nr:AI-2E family transporter [Akkermansiaceae bacterium]
MDDSPTPLRKTEPLLGWLALLLLLGGCFFVLKPFLTALTWAMILSYSLFPLQKVFTRWFRGSRTLAACLVTLTVAVIFAGPVVFIGVTLAQDGRDLAIATRTWFMSAPEKPPEWLAELPGVGDELGEYWTGFAEDRNRWIDELDQAVEAEPKVTEGDEGALPSLIDEKPPAEAEELGAVDDPGSPHIVAVIARLLVSAKSWLIAAGVAVGQGVTQVLVSALLAFFLLRDAPELSERLGVILERLAGQRGRHLIKVAGDTVRGVVFGILGTAVIQSVIAGIGFWIANVPGTVLLAVMTFFLAVILPFGPPLIWGPAALWLFSQGQTWWGVFMLIWGVFAISSVDNVVRPILISQTSQLPFALIFCGVIGGALAFGLVGIFLGPTLLAVAFRLIEEWSSNRIPLAVADGPGELVDNPEDAG